MHAHLCHQGLEVYTGNEHITALVLDFGPLCWRQWMHLIQRLF